MKKAHELQCGYSVRIGSADWFCQEAVDHGDWHLFTENAIAAALEAGVCANSLRPVELRNPCDCDNGNVITCPVHGPVPVRPIESKETP